MGKNPCELVWYVSLHHEGQERVADKGPVEEICCLGLTPEGEGEAGGKQIKLKCKSPIFSRVNENNVR